MKQFGQQVDVEFGKGVDFPKYKTYRLQEGTQTMDSFLDQLIVAAIEDHLSMKGIRKVQADPDMSVTYHAFVQEQPQVDTTNWRYGWRWGAEASASPVYECPVGTLIVEMWDCDEERMIWRGVATDSVSIKSKKREEKINKAMEKMFEKFPPEK